MAVSEPARAQAAKLLARPGSWPPAAPHPRVAIDAIQTMLQLCSGNYEADAPHCATFAEAGGIRAVVQVLEETAEHAGRMAKVVAPHGSYANVQMSPEVQMMMMIADLQEMGITLLSNYAALAEAGEGAALQELRAANAIGAVVRSVRLYPENPEHAATALAALVQLLPVDEEGFLASGAPEAIVALLHAAQTTPWARYLGTRALARLAEGGALARTALKEAGALAALLRACREPPGASDCGREWGVADVPAKLQVLARKAISLLAGGGGGGFAVGGRSAGSLAIQPLLLQDPVVLADVDGPLQGCAATIVAAGDGGIGPTADGVYGVRVEMPPERCGESAEVRPTQLRLMLP